MAGQTTSDGNNEVSNKSGSESDRAIMFDLMTEYLQHRHPKQQQQQRQNGKRPSPLIDDLKSAVLGLTNDYEQRYSRQLEDLRSNWIIDPSYPRESFKQVLDSVFVDDCNWGRFVTIFVFASLFMRQCQRQGVDMAPADLCDWAADYVVQTSVLAWIKRNDGWLGLIRFYKDGDNGSGAGQPGATGAANGPNDGGVLTRLLTVAGAGLAIVGLTSFLRA